MKVEVREQVEQWLRNKTFVLRKLYDMGVRLEISHWTFRLGDERIDYRLSMVRAFEGDVAWMEGSYEELEEVLNWLIGEWR